MVKAFLQLPSAYIREGIVINLKISSQVHNKVLDRQNWQQIAGFLTQYYQGLAQLAMPLGNPQMIQLIFTKGLSALTEAMRQILETYDVRNIDRIIVKELDLVLKGQISTIIGGGNGSLPLPNGPQPNNRVTGSSEATGMEQLLSLITGNRGGGGGNGVGIS